MRRLLSHAKKVSAGLIIGIALLPATRPSSDNAAAAGSLRFLYVTVPAAAGLNPVSVPPITTFRWATFGSTDPAEYRRILVSTAAFGGSFIATENYIRNTPGAPEWSAWQTYSPPGVGTYWTTPPTDAGGYVFAVQGRDADGNVGQEFDLANLRRVRILGTTPTEVTTWGVVKIRFKP